MTTFLVLVSVFIYFFGGYNFYLYLESETAANLEAYFNRDLESGEILFAVLIVVFWPLIILTIGFVNYRKLVITSFYNRRNK